MSIENTPKSTETPKPFTNFSLGQLDKYLEGDKLVWLVIILLSLSSFLVVYSATGTVAFKTMKGSFYYMSRHFGHMALGLMAVWLAHRVDYRYYARLSRLALLVVVPLLIAAWLFGTAINDANRWLAIPLIGISFQPSDLAKLALIASIASMLAKRQDNVEDIQDIMPVLAWTGVICTLIGMSNVSTAILLFFTSMVLMFIGRIPVNQLLLFFLTGVVSIMLALVIGQRLETASSRMDRFLNPTSEQRFQEEQGYIAVSTGGLIGKGPGNSDQRNFLPNAFSDFIYAIIIEEYGLVGGLFILALYLLLLYRGMVIMATSTNPFGGLLAAGLSLSIVVQALAHMAVVVGLVPVTGLPLPMLSMGGTSLTFTGLSLGVILSISRGEVDRNATEILGNDETENVVRERE
ncbi:MAG: cell division protein FtsW [Bacteroidetes bacterium]|nr:MAG: cell division protein FtsW [Bacteroidota bacterium]